MLLLFLAPLFSLLFFRLYKSSPGLFTLLVEATTLLIVLVWTRLSFARLRKSSLWTTLPSVKVTFLALALVLLAGFGAQWALSAFAPAAWWTQTPSFRSSGSDFPFMLLAVGLVGPFLEELIFRGYLLTGYEKSMSGFNAALNVSVLFALIHHNPIQTLGVLPFAWIVTRAVQHTRSLWTSVTLHVINNSLLVVLQRVFSSTPRAATDVVSRLDPFWGYLGLGLVTLTLWGATHWLKPKPTLERDPLGADEQTPEQTPEQTQVQSGFWSGSLVVVMVVSALALVGAALARTA